MSSTEGNFLDHANAAEGKDSAGGDNAEADDSHHRRDEMSVSFPSKLFEMLSDEQNSDVIAWLPHGRGFRILDRPRFTDELLPLLSNGKQAKFTSFTRKLNRWNFTRVTRGPEAGAYYHHLFQRDNERLCLQMSCIGNKNQQAFLNPMNPVALGLSSSAAAPAFLMDTNNPQAMAMLLEQQRMLQQQNMMAMAAFQQLQQQPPSSSPPQADGSADAAAAMPSAAAEQQDETKSSENDDTTGAAALQQQQYYSMLMAQAQMAALAGGVPPGISASPLQQQSLPLPSRRRGASSSPESQDRKPSADTANI